jgi:hypothetical protein
MEQKSGKGHPDNFSAASESGLKILKFFDADPDPESF